MQSNAPNIFIVADIYDINSGGGRQLSYTLPALSKKANIVVILTKESSLSSFLRIKNLRVEIIRCMNPMDLLFTLRVYCFILQMNSDTPIIHTHTERTSFLINPLAFLLNIPVITTVHRSLLRGSPWRSNTFKSRFFLFIENTILRYLTSQVVVISSDLGDELVHSRQIPAYKVAIISNTVPPPRFSPSFSPSALNITNKNVIRIASILRSSHEKGSDLFFSDIFIETCTLLNENIEIILIGIQISPLLCSQILKIEECHPRINFTIVERTSNVYSLLVYSDIYIQPSRSEAFCISVIEASLIGLPIIANDLDVFREVLSGYNKFRLLSLHDPLLGPEVLSSCIKDLLNLPQKAPFLQHIGRWDEYPYSINHTSPLLHQIYEKISKK